MSEVLSLRSGGAGSERQYLSEVLDGERLARRWDGEVVQVKDGQRLFRRGAEAVGLGGERRR